MHNKILNLLTLLPGALVLAHSFFPSTPNVFAEYSLQAHTTNVDVYVMFRREILCHHDYNICIGCWTTCEL